MDNCNNCEKLSVCIDAIGEYKSVKCPFFKYLLEIEYGDDEFYCVVNGDAFYKLENNEVVLERITDECYAYEMYELIDGEIFLAGFMSGYFDPTEGDFCGVVVDGYVSNIRFDDCETPYDMWYSSEEFDCVLTYAMWKELCSKHEVKVNWANK